MKSSDTKSLSDFGFLSGGNMAYLESLYQETNSGKSNSDLSAPLQQWGEVFSTLPEADQAEVTTTATDGASQVWLENQVHKQARVSKLIMAYRSLGHLLADVDPIGVMPRGDASEVELDQYDLSEQDLDTEFDVGGMAAGGTMTLRKILEFLREIYCGSIGYEIRYINSLEKRAGFSTRWNMNRNMNLIPKKSELSCCPDSLLRKDWKIPAYQYVGQKRFSLEGGDSLIPMLSDLIQQFGARGVKEVVIGMAHRGRLNVLVNILGKAPRELFSEFEGEYETEDEDTNTGDVKYHQGASSDIQTPGGNVHVALSFNPSHLEIIAPVVEVRCAPGRSAGKIPNVNRLFPL